MICVRSVTYEMKFNDQNTDIIIPGRGLRQGDPLSLYLFIICAEWLSWMISKSQIERKIDGIQICRRAPPITHLFFADDSLFFFKINKRSIDEVKRILISYESISGQKINFAKSEICRNVGMQDRLWISSILNVKIVNQHGKYLGMPFIYGPNKRDT